MNQEDIIARAAFLYHVNSRTLVEFFLHETGHNTGEVWFRYMREFQPLPGIVIYHLSALITAHGKIRGIQCKGKRSRSSRSPRR